MIQTGVNHWWSNWPVTHGYVCNSIFYPQSVDEISEIIRAVTPDFNIKAVGGGWSFSDASMPLNNQAKVDAASIHKIGQGAAENLGKIIQVLSGNQAAQPMDLTPEKVDLALIATENYNENTLSQEVNLAGLPIAPVRWPVLNPSLEAFFTTVRNVDLINLSKLVSSLQQQFPLISSPNAKAAMLRGTNYFHVEGGITMADLDQLLDHQKPRLAVLSSGGSPGATLAGTISTATHGGEFQWPLLVDCVRAIHFVGPTGDQWWIEGTKSIADPLELAAVYPGFNTTNFIGGNWNGIPGLTAQDVLNAVIVSMGTMGVIYSVVLEVSPQFGIQQKVIATNWNQILSAAGAGMIGSLRANNANANMAVLNVLLDGTLNGTGIPLANNVYADLAINPFSQDCWVTNRQVTPTLPLDSNGASPGIGDYLSSVSNALATRGSNKVNSSSTLGRIFDFLGYSTDIPLNLDDLKNDFDEAGTLINFITSWPDLITAVLSTVNVQAVLNEKAGSLNGQDKANRGHLFISDFLTGFLNAIQGTVMQNMFGSLTDSGSLFWSGDFNDKNSDKILFYHPSDGRWWLGTFVNLPAAWGLASDTTNGINQFGPLDGGRGMFWTGDFNGSGSDQILFYHPGDGNWFLGTFNEGAMTWPFVSNTTTGTNGVNEFGPLDGGRGIFWIGDFNGLGSDQILFYHPGDGNWFLGTFNNGVLTWPLVSNTTTGTNGANEFGPLDGGRGMFWTGDFNGSGSDQILFYHPGDGNWFLGTFNNGVLTWPFISNTTTGTNGANKFGPLDGGRGMFWTGDFNGSGSDQILFYHPGDGNWFLGTFKNGAMTWPFVSNTTTGTNGANKFGPLDGGRGMFWVGDFNGSGSDQILFYHPGDGNWFIGTFNNGAMTWPFVSNTTTGTNGANEFGPLDGGRGMFWTGDYNGSGSDQILFYHPSDGNWFLGTFIGGSISWAFASNTTRGTSSLSDHTDIAYKVGAIGWPGGGIPGRGIEIALDPSKAFSFLQTQLFDDILTNTMINGIKPLIGYISIRVCPTTSTFFGMQQYGPFSVMIEIVGYRSPESDVLMDQIQQRVQQLNQTGLNAMLHWGLENDQLSAADLQKTPLNNPIHPGSEITKLAGFSTIRKFFLGQKRFNPFDNNFTRRFGL
jgi:hypothetical protein